MHPYLFLIRADERWTNRRYQAGVRLGELEADFREARLGREKATAAASSAPIEAENAAAGAIEGYLPSSPTAPRRHSAAKTAPPPLIQP